MTQRRIGLALVSLFALCLTANTMMAAEESKPKERKHYTEPPKMTIDVNKTYTATFDTSKGKIVCELYPKDAPGTVNNFVFLSREGFYDGLTFHRVIKDFMIQGGDPQGTGTGGPGYHIKDEAKDNPHKHQTGSLAMARTSAPDSAGCQFYITHKATSWLDGGYTIFGQVKEGQTVVDAIEIGDTITSIKIEEK